MDYSRFFDSFDRFADGAFQYAGLRYTAGQDGGGTATPTNGGTTTKTWEKPAPGISSQTLLILGGIGAVGLVLLLRK